MRLTEMGVKPTAKKINKVMESRFGIKIDYENLNFPKAYKLARGLTESLNHIKNLNKAKRDREIKAFEQATEEVILVI